MPPRFPTGQYARNHPSTGRKYAVSAVAALLRYARAYPLSR